LVHIAFDDLQMTSTGTEDTHNFLENTTLSATLPGGHNALAGRCTGWCCCHWTRPVYKHI